MSDGQWRVIRKLQLIRRWWRVAQCESEAERTKRSDESSHHGRPYERRRSGRRAVLVQGLRCLHQRRPLAQGRSVRHCCCFTLPASKREDRQIKKTKAARLSGPLIVDRLRRPSSKNKASHRSWTRQKKNELRLWCGARARAMMTFFVVVAMGRLPHALHRTQLHMHNAAAQIDCARPEDDEKIWRRPSNNGARSTKLKSSTSVMHFQTEHFTWCRQLLEYLRNITFDTRSLSPKQDGNSRGSDRALSSSSRAGAVSLVAEILPIRQELLLPDEDRQATGRALALRRGRTPASGECRSNHEGDVGIDWRKIEDHEGQDW